MAFMSPEELSSAIVIFVIMMSQQAHLKLRQRMNSVFQWACIISVYVISRLHFPDYHIVLYFTDFYVFTEAEVRLFASLARDAEMLDAQDPNQWLACWALIVKFFLAVGALPGWFWAYWFPGFITRNFQSTIKMMERALATLIAKIIEAFRLEAFLDEMLENNLWGFFPISTVGGRTL